MNKLEKILRENRVTEKASADFSSAVMKNVYSEAEEEAVQEAVLEQLLRRLPAGKPSAGFTARTMQKVSATSEPRPLLGLWGRAALAALVAVAWAIWRYLSPAETSFGPIAQKFSSLPSLNIAPVYALSVLGMGVLLLLDYFIRKNRAHKFRN